MGEEPLVQDLLKDGLITEEQVRSAREHHASTGGPLPRILVKLGHVKESSVLEYMAKREGLQIVQAEDVQLDEEALSKLPRVLVDRHEMVPLKRDGSTIKVALPDASDMEVIEEVRFLTGLEVEMALISSSDARKILDSYYHKGTGPAGPRPRTGARDAAGKVGGPPPSGPEAARALSRMDAPAAKLVKALAALLIDRKVISAAELEDWLHRLE